MISFKNRKRVNAHTHNAQRRMSKHAVALSLMMGCIIGGVPDAYAAKTFFCKATISTIGDTTPPPVSLSGPLVHDMSPVGSCTDAQYEIQWKPKCSSPARSACSLKAAGDAHHPGDANYNSAAFWCAKGAPDGSTIKAYAAVGPDRRPKGEYSNVDTKGVLINKPAVTKTTYDCEGIGGWLDNPSTGNGGHARCVTNSCNAVSGVPIAPAWTSIGTAWSAPGPAWLTDASGNIWYGVPAHATTTVVSPAECRWQ